MTYPEEMNRTRQAGDTLLWHLRTDGSIVATGLFFTTDIGPGEATDYEFREINHNDYILDKGINLPNFELDSYSNQKNSVGDSKEQKSIEINNKPIEVFETDKNFDSVFYSCDNIILKFNDYIRIYNIATKKFIDFEKAIISYDMKHIAYLKTEKKILYDNIKKTFSCLITFNINTNSIEDIWDLGTKTVKDFIFSTTNILIITKTYYMSSDKYTVHAFSNSKNYETKGPYRGTEYKKYKDFNKNLNKKTYYNYMELNNTELQIVVDKNSIHIKNKNSNETYKTLTLEGQITSANFSNDGKKIIILLNKKKVLIWDILE